LVALRTVGRRDGGDGSSDLRGKVLLAVLLALFGAAATLFEIPVWAETVRCTEMKAQTEPQGRYGGGGGGGGRGNGAVGQAYGLLNFFYALGMTVGPLLTGFIYDAAGWGRMTLVLGLLCALTAIPAGLCTGGYIWEGWRARDAGTAATDDVPGGEV
jgi:hypothetical protein